MQQTFIIILIILSSFIPILLWWYSFSYLDNSKLNKKRFIFWIMSGVLSVFPILYMDKRNNIFNIWVFNISKYLSWIWTLKLFFPFFFSILAFVFLFFFFSLILWFILKVNIFEYKKVIKNILIICFFSFLIVLFFYLINYFFQRFPKLNFTILEATKFWDISLNSLKLVIFYYLIVWVLEEISKYFNFSWQIIKNISVKEGVLYSIFIALGFSFIENILYLYNLFSIYNLSFDFLKIYFFRSIFSVILHVFCSSLLAYSFIKALSYYNEWNIFKYIKLFLYGLILSVFLHFFFDLCLTLGFSFIIIIYLIVWYLYVTSIFYKD